MFKPSTQATAIAQSEKFAAAHRSSGDADLVGEFGLDLDFDVPVQNDNPQNDITTVAPHAVPEIDPGAYNLERLARMSFATSSFDDGDVGNAQRFEMLFGDVFKYCTEKKSWMFFNSKIWEVCKNSEAQTAMLATIAAIKEELRVLKMQAVLADQTAPIHSQVKSLAAHHKASSTAAKIVAALEVARMMPSMKIRHSDFNSKNVAHLFNTATGTLNLRDGSLRQFDKNDYITLTSEVEVADNDDCPLFKDTLKGIFLGDDVLIRYVQKVLGSSLLGERKKSQEFYLFLGVEGSNGKSTLMNTIAKALGSYVACTSAHTWMQKREDDSAAASPDLAELINARLVLAAELPRGKSFNENRIKSFTGGDKMTTRSLYENVITFDPIGTLILSSNHRPRISADDNSMWRRNRSIPFNAKFSKTDAGEHLEENLEKELPQILRWLVDGCLAYQAEGIREIPQAVQDCTLAHRDSFDTVKQFINEAVEFVDERRTTKTGDLYHSFVTYSKENGLQNVMLRKNFVESMARLGYKEADPAKHKNQKVFTGLALKDFDI